MMTWQIRYLRIFVWESKFRENKIMPFINSKITKNSIILILKIVVILVLFFPRLEMYKDGGSRSFKALLYEVHIRHRMDPSLEGDYEDGIRISILGIKVFSNVKN